MKTEKLPVSPLGTAPGWRERALERSQAITDAWEVTKTYAGRLAEWVLFGCMVMNILQILPGVSLWPAVSNLVLGTQVVMLDVGGFSLASMAEQAREQGDERAAGRASRTGFLLIGIMMLTLLLVSVGVLWPAAKVYTDLAEKALILVRVVMTVLYSHVIHSLRRMGVQQQQASVSEVFAELSARISASEARLSEQGRTLEARTGASLRQQHEQLTAELAGLQQRVQEQLAAELAHLSQRLGQYEAAGETLMRQQTALAEAVHEAREATTRQREATHASHEANRSASSRTPHEAKAKVLPLKQREQAPTEKRATVYALLADNPHLSSYEMAEQTGYPPSTIQRYMKDWKRRQTEAEHEATDSAI